MDLDPIKLSKPIKAHGEELTELTLREPTGADVKRAGLPATMMADESIKMDPKAVCRYIVLLGKIPESSVDQMAPADITQAFMLLLPFFFPSEEEGETETSKNQSGK